MPIAFRAVLVEDDPDLRKLIQVTLKITAGWDVSTAANGAEGIELVHRLRPDCVIVDLMMPDMDGYEVCRRLKSDEASATIPLVFLTARKEVDVNRAQAVGAAGVLYKPFDAATLATQVRELIAAP